MDEREYRLKDESQIITPSLIYYKDMIEENIRISIEIAGDVNRLWPHIKTHKCAELVRLLISYGIRKFKTATIAEAEMAARCGAEQIILAYPLIGPNISRFITLQNTFPQVKFWAIGDSWPMVEQLAEQSLAAGLESNLLVDVDMGMGRTGVPADQCLEFYLRCAQLKGVKVGGFHCYDGHRGEPDINERKQLVAQSVVPVMEAREALRAQGTEPVMVMGGTPSFPCHAEYEGTYLAPGTCFLNDAGYGEKFKDLPFRKAAVVMARVVSHPTGKRFALDLGYKAICADPLPPRGVLVGHETEYRTVMQNEEHWVFEPVDESADLPPIGTVFYVVPIHICTTTLMYPEALLAENGSISATWEITARNRKLTI